MGSDGQHQLRWGGPVAAACFSAAVLLVVRVHFTLPAPGREPPAAAAFSEDRALTRLLKIVACGVRPVGSWANEVCAAGAVAEELRGLASEAAERDRTLEFHTQHASGSFFIDFIGGFTNTYANITNVVARLHGTGHADEAQPGPSWCDPPRALLVSSHFDSAMGSHAAADASQNIAMMLEMIGNLLHREGLPVDVIWNFNGGEETIMQAAHGFITTHKWARHVCAVINLEAIGVGSRELVFQTGPKNGWIVDAYAAAAKAGPHGSSVVQAIFQSGIIPGDTDFRIYRDFGKVPGVDFAVTGNGYAYHTPQDSMAAIQAARGSLQRYGENVLGLIGEMAVRLPSVLPEDAERVMCFFDVLGTVLVVYDMATGLAVHGAALLVAATAVGLRWSRGDATPAGTLRAAALLLAGAAACLAAAAAAGVALYLGGAGMVWYSRPLLIGPLLAAPALATGLHWFRCRCAACRPAEVQAAAVALPALALGLATALRSPVGYLPLLWVLCPVALAWPLEEVSAFWAPLAWAAALAVPWVCTLQLLVLGLEVFTPLMGRSGSVVPGALIVAAFLGAILGIVVMLSAPLLSRVRADHSRLAEGALLLLMASTAAPAMLVPRAMLPYDAAHPKRLYLQHFSRGFYAADVAPALDEEATALPLSGPSGSGSWVMVMPLDYERLTPVGGFDFFGAANHTVDKFSRADWPSVYAQLPYYFPVVKMMRPEGAALLPAPALELPAGHGPLRVAVAAQRRPGGVARLRLTLSASGPQMVAALPARGLRAWSLGELPEARADCDCHWVLHAVGGQPQPPERTWSFWLDVDQAEAKKAPYAMEFYAHWLDGPTRELGRLAAELPEFVTPTAWPSMWQSLQLHW